MAFWTQLMLLLWKNFQYRRRQPGLPASGRCLYCPGEPQCPQNVGQPGEIDAHVKDCTRSKWEAGVFCFLRVLSRSLPLFLTLAWIYLVSLTVKAVVREETRLRYTMRAMGLSGTVLWLGWFLSCCLWPFLSTILLVMVLKLGDILPYSHPVVLFLFLAAFAVVTVVQSFLLSTFFSHANLAAACGGLMYFVLYLPYSILSPVAFGFGCESLALLEEQGEVAQWHNMGTGPVADVFSLAQVSSLLLLDAAHYGLTTWYLETVSRCLHKGPGEALPGNPTPALCGLSLDFFQGHITAFLGCNGAGKTTILSILSGLFLPTGGSAYILGHGVQSNMAYYRRAHLVLRSKGLSVAAVDSEQDSLLQDLGLVPKRCAQMCHLSGGMRWKLSVAIAFVGSSRVVILDEPTAGVDPASCRNIWELLLKYREGRTLILSTHHLDEAELLGDRVAVVAGGRLCCCGSLSFLRRHLGSGYYLMLAKSPQSLATSTKDDTNLEDGMDSWQERELGSLDNRARTGLKSRSQGVWDEKIFLKVVEDCAVDTDPEDGSHRQHPCVGITHPNVTTGLRILPEESALEDGELVTVVCAHSLALLFSLIMPPFEYYPALRLSPSMYGAQVSFFSAADLAPAACFPIALLQPVAPPAPQALSGSGEIVQNLTGQNLSDFLVKTYPRLVCQGYLPGGPRCGPAIGIWFNNRGWHAMVAFVNRANNALLHARLPPGPTRHAHSITTFNHPLNLTKEQLSEATLMTSSVDVLVSICVIFTMSFIPASFTLVLIEERVTRAKYLQFMGGLPPTLYCTAYVTLTCISLFIGINSSMVTFMLELLSDQKLQKVSQILKQVFLIFPHFCLGRGLIDMVRNQAMADAFERFGENFPPGGEEDEDVAREREWVVEGATQGDVLVLRDLTKVYPSRGHQLLTICAWGSPLVSVTQEPSMALCHMGYCPQSDAIFELLTGREHLELFACLCGVPKAKIVQTVSSSLGNLGLQQYADLSAGTYSGGNKRKLATAVGLVGDPTVVFLDEPTTGVDPSTRRSLWNSLLSVVREGRSVVLTSHSMEECEVLCTCLAIMVNGRFRCLGSLQHLNGRFRAGHRLTLRVSSGKYEPVVAFVAAAFPGAELRRRMGVACASSCCQEGAAP
ncbi:phospholipid-transporting ATPase ABCA7 [Saccopteryx bilineata]|uniref:phospholipid-transporting ATPase ABCA7 n=1 Tax=Saccopteryx bilineata TaxID=59482 RepID=UPI00338EE3AF